MKWGLAFLLLTGCTAQTSLSHYDSAIEQLQTEVADARHTQHSQETEIEILEDRVRRQDPAKLLADLQALNRRIAEMERKQQQFAEQRQVLALEQELKSQVSAIKGAMASVVELAQRTGGHTVTVKGGDTLEKIARREQSTIKKLKEANGLSSDRIYAGQELQIP